MKKKKKKEEKNEPFVAWNYIQLRPNIDDAQINGRYFSLLGHIDTL